MFGNIFTGQSFGGVEMTNAIIAMPLKNRQLANLIPWKVSTSLTPLVAIDQEAGLVRVLPSTPRNGVAPLRKTNKRRTASIEIPGFSERDTILNSSLMGVRETGSNAVKTIEGERNKSLDSMDGDIEETHERQRGASLTGNIDDVDGTVLANVYDILGEEQTTVDLNLTLATKDIDDQLIEIKQLSEAKLGGIKPERYLLLQGKNDSNKTLKLKAVKEQANNPTNVLLQRTDNRSGVRIVNDVDIVGYSGSYIDPDKSYFIPIFEDCARTIYGPSEVEEYWGNVLPRYVTRELLKHGKGVEIEVWSYFIDFFTRPGSVFEVNVTAA